jgi:hypothetical protein
MLGSGFLVVHVVDSGTDWLAFASVLSTGVAAVAGVVGNILQARRHHGGRTQPSLGSEWVLGARSTPKPWRH